MDPPPTGLAGMAGADCGSPERDDARGARDARDSAVGLSDVVAAAPVRSVHQAISCRPEDVRKPARGNSVHRGFAGNADGTTHHGGSHHGYMAFKIQKLAEQNEVVAGRATRGEHDPASSNASNASGGVFHGVCIHVNGITDPPWMDLKDIMLANGGRFANYYSRVAVTHVVCAGLTAAKLAALKKADRNHPPVVHPAWVTQSLKAGKLLPCASFALEGTLEPGQRRIAAFAANLAPKNAGARFENDGGDDDDGGDTEIDSDLEDALEDALVAPTQRERDVRTDADELTETKRREHVLGETTARKKADEPEPEPEKKDAFLRVAFFAVRDHLEALPPGDDDARASARFAATRAASAAAYAALASMVDAELLSIVPVSAWEALVVPSGSGTGGKRVKKTHLDAEASRLAEALRAAGVEAGAVPATEPAGTRDGEVSFASVGISDDANATRDPLLDPALDPPREMAGAPGGGGGLKKEKTPRETRKRVRWSEGVEANDFFTKKKKNAAGVGVSSRENVARDDDDSFAPAAGTDAVAASKASERAARYARRSSFAAAAAAPETDKIDDETWASLPPEVRDEISRFQPGTRATPLGARGSSKARRIHDPTTGESPGGVAFDAFGAHLGVRAARFVPGEAKRPAGPAGPAGPAATPPARRAGKRKDAGGDAGDDGLPASFSQIDPEVLEAIGEEEARTLRAHYERAAREKIMRARRAGARTRSKGGKNAAAAGQKNAASFFAKTSPDPPRRTRVAVADDGDDGIRATDICDDRGGDREGDREGGPFATATNCVSRTHASAVRTERKENVYAPARSDEEVDALAASLETAVHALVAEASESFVGGDEGTRPSESTAADAVCLETLDAAAVVLQDQACAFVRDDALEWTQRLMLRGLELCGASAAHATFWKPRFDEARARVDRTVRREHDGAVLVLRKRTC